MRSYYHHCKKCGKAFYSPYPVDKCYKCGNNVVSYHYLIVNVLRAVYEGYRNGLRGR